MSTYEWCTVLAAAFSPLAALWAQRILDHVRARAHRKLMVFNVLMATRTARVSPDHVAALNRITMDFAGARVFGMRWQSKAEKKVTDAWKAYHDHLHHGDGNAEAWRVDSNRLFIDLLFEMSGSVGYDFDRVDLLRTGYSPVAHGQLEDNNRVIRESLVEILSGNSAIPIALMQGEEVLEQNKKVQQAVIASLNPDRVISVKLVEGNTEVGAKS